MELTLSELHDRLVAAGHPIASLSQLEDAVTIEFEREVTAAERSAAETLLEQLRNPPDFNKLTLSLRGSEFWMKMLTAADNSLRASNAFTLAMSSLTSTHNLGDLRFAFARLQEEAGSAITANDRRWLRDRLREANFEPGEFGL